MYLPALQAAADDHRALRGAPLTLYLWLLCGRLDVQKFLPVPIKETGTELGMNRDTVSDALNLLVERGYLERRIVYPHKYRFRLLFSRIPVKVIENPHAA